MLWSRKSLKFLKSILSSFACVVAHHGSSAQPVLMTSNSSSGNSPRLRLRDSAKSTTSASASSSSCLSLSSRAMLAATDGRTCIRGARARATRGKSLQLSSCSTSSRAARGVGLRLPRGTASAASGRSACSGAARAGACEASTVPFVFGRPRFALALGSPCGSHGTSATSSSLTPRGTRSVIVFVLSCSGRGLAAVCGAVPALETALLWSDGSSPRYRFSLKFANLDVDNMGTSSTGDF
mmetsp:Transcript_152204/g.265307  ORF Transcript_152204/g.265307 Transcript_152204/m.265307 type:complete len:239 (-) Transcript_152204:109-825(-)